MSESNLKKADPIVFEILQNEKKRQKSGLELIASENFTSPAVLEVLGSEFTNKYSEGLPNKRYYGGNNFIDELELLTQKRALNAFDLHPDTWGVNVQAYSGSIANLAAMNAVLVKGDRFMGMDLSCGGHLSHGFKMNISSSFYESLSYDTDNNGIINYSELEFLASKFKPKLIIAGASAYPRDISYQKIKEIAGNVGAVLMCDIAHTAGLIASKLLNNPFEFADIVTTTTHKSLRGPRGAMIFYRKSLENKINFSVFPCIQGGPHNNNIAGICVQMAEVSSPEFKEYSKQVIKNCKVLCDTLTSFGYEIITGGSDNHLLLWKLKGISGSKVEFLFDLCGLTVNKNMVSGDKSALSPSGIRIGTPALTTRGFIETDFIVVAHFLKNALELAMEIQCNCSSKLLVDFKKKCEDYKLEINKLKKDIENFSLTFK